MGGKTYYAWGVFVIILFTSVLAPSHAQEDRVYPLSPHAICGDGKECIELIDLWNDASWDSVVDEEFSSEYAAVRWLTSEYTTPYESSSGRRTNGCGENDFTNHKFCGVTDEFSNVLLSFSMGTDQTRYDMLHSFSELLRNPLANNLQCWNYYVDGERSYETYLDVCVYNDSASDASLRILGAYAIACAKQRAGFWNGTIDYCEDYVEQGNAIVTDGELIITDEGEWFLANGYRNARFAPESYQSFRPDYYELQFLMDFAVYQDRDDLKDAVRELVAVYADSMGDNYIHTGKTGSFSDGRYECNELCSPAYMDNIDTWRAIPALSGLYNVYAEEFDDTFFSEWWDRYGGGNSFVTPTGVKPFEIYADSEHGYVKSAEDSYKTSAMWIPLAARFDESYAIELTQHLVDQYDFSNHRFYGSLYHGAYYSQFAQRAIGHVSGIIDPLFWSPLNVTPNGVIIDADVPSWEDVQDQCLFYYDKLQALIQSRVQEDRTKEIE